MTNTVFQTDTQINDNSHKLITIGFYYKNDSRKGFGSMLSAPDDKPLDISVHQESFKKQLDFIKQKSHPDFKTLKDWSDTLLNQLDRFIPEYNKQCGFEDGLQPLKHRIVDFDNRIVQMLHTLITNNIYILTQLGVLVNDEYNGISYHYEKKLTDDELVSMLQKMGV